jgi:hypothetical protein
MPERGLDLWNSLASCQRARILAAIAATEVNPPRSVDEAREELIRWLTTLRQRGKIINKFPRLSNIYYFLARRHAVLAAVLRVHPFRS